MKVITLRFLSGIVIIPVIIPLDKCVSTVEAGIEGEGDGGKQHLRSEEEEVTGALEHCRTVLIFEGIEHEIHT